MTGRGMPDRATRNLLSVLSTQVPSFALVDADPCGFVRLSAILDFFVDKNRTTKIRHLPNIPNRIMANEPRRFFGLTKLTITWCFTQVKQK